jgi:polysaccharide transporter, PST family
MAIAKIAEFVNNGMPDLKSTIFNAGWLVSDRIIRLVLNFIAGILIARALGPEDFGMLSYGQALIFLFTPIATVGLPEIIVRELSRRTGSEQAGEKQEIISSALAVRLISALFTIALMAAMALVVKNDSPTAMIIIIFYSFSIAPQSLDIIESALQSEGMFKLVSVARSINSVVFAIIRIASVFLHADVIWFVILYGSEILVFGVFYLVIARRVGMLPSFKIVRYARMRELVISSLPLMLRLIAIAIYMRIDQVMVEALLGTEQLGVYSVAVRVSELWYFVPTAIMAAAFPRLTRSYEDGMEAYDAELRYWMRMMMMIALPAALMLSLMSNLVVDILFGDAYSEAGPVLSVQAWSGVFVAIGVATSPWFINTGQLRFGLYQAGIGAIASIALNLLLIPRFGMLGASLSMVISYAISAVLCNAMFHETRSVFRMQIKAMLLK